MTRSSVLGVSSLALAIAAWTGASWAIAAHSVKTVPRSVEEGEPTRFAKVAVSLPGAGGKPTRFTAMAMADVEEEVVEAEEDVEGADGDGADALRSEALEKGLDALENVDVPEPSNLDDFVKDKKAAIALGKALFWDMQVGSDGQACASCHFHAGADNRVRNQLSPGINRVDDPSRDPDPDLEFGNEDGRTGSGGEAGPNYKLEEDDFPFHRLEDPEDRESCTDGEDDDGDGDVDFDDEDCFDTNDAASSQGTFNGAFSMVAELEDADELERDECGPADDPTFQIDGIAVRKVEPRNTPTMINAVFNHRNFWDGRANNIFNGLNPFGERGLLPTPSNPDPGTLYRERDGDVVKVQVRIDNASLASQAVGPPNNPFEMSCDGRNFADLADKLQHLRPLAFQKVHREDSVLDRLRHRSGVGLDTTYSALIKKAFRKEYWAGEGRFDANGDPVRRGGYSQMEVNLPLFFGLAVQLYEATLVSDDAEFDDFMEGDNEALDEVQQFGLSVFLNEGKCINCHVGAEFTGAAVQFRANEPFGNEEPIERMIMGDGGVALYDGGFYNIGVRPTFEDLGVGASLLGFPLSFARQITTHDCGPRGDESCLIDDFNFDTDEFEVPGRIVRNERVAVDGAFKVPGLRNVELTGPYFHNGGQATLAQVVEFYDRGGDRVDAGCDDTTGFAENCSNLDPDIQRLGLGELTREIDGYVVTGKEALVEFLLTLTDERVRDEEAPFDHPQLFVSDGEKGDEDRVRDDGTGRARDRVLEVEAVGEDGNEDELETFLDLDPQDD